MMFYGKTNAVVGAKVISPELAKAKDKSEMWRKIANHAKRHRSSLVIKISGKAGGIPQAEDAVQEMYARALKYWESYEEGGDFIGWLEVILSNVVKDHKKENRAKGIVYQLNLEEERVEDRMDSDQWLAVRQAWERLTYQHKWSLYLFFVQGYTSKEVCQITSINHNTLRSRVARFKEDVKRNVS